MENLPSGLTYIRNIINTDEHDMLVDFLKRQEWSKDISRETLHYGYKYNYGGQPLTKCESIPEILLKLFQEQRIT